MNFHCTELAKEGLPLPFGNKFWASNWPTGKSPLPGLIIHFIPSVSTNHRTVYKPHLRSIVSIAYCHYCPSTVCCLPVHPRCRRLSGSNHKSFHRRGQCMFPTLYSNPERSDRFVQGLFYLRWKKPNAVRPFKGNA